MRSKSLFRLVPLFGAALLLGLTLAGCNESVTPDDEIVVTDEDVAHQSGYVAYAMVEVLPVMAGRSAVPELESLEPPFMGEFWYDNAPDVGDEHAWTDDEHMLSLYIEEFGTDVIFEFDLTGAWSGDALTVNGEGTVTIGSLHLGFDVIDVVIFEGIPVSGSINIFSSGNEATVTFDEGTATVVAGDLTFTIDLSDGSLIE